MGIVRALAKRNSCYIYNFVMSNILADTVAAARGDSVQWASMYILKERDYVKYAVEQIERLGFKAIVLTCDHPHGRVRNSLMWCLSHPENPKETVISQNFQTFQRGTGRALELGFGSNDESVTWADVRTFIQSTRLPVICKGILTVEAARAALDAGAAGVYVSNHGCRQMDCEPGAIRVLSEIVEAVGGRVPVFIDSGFRTGSQVLKAIALGASGVMVGRPVLFGLAAAGEAGVSKALEVLDKELEYDMKGTGCCTLDGITPHVFYQSK
jgi:(S)-2-hydroxy-acid oxidase